MLDVVIVAESGPNPASLAELIWALHRQRGMRAIAVYLLVSRRNSRWLETEFLQPGAALEQLQQVLGPGLVGPAAVHQRPVVSDGVWLEDDQEQPELWNAARWGLFQEAIATAGPQPVVFGLIGGRRRTQHATTAVMFQLLGREQDLCLDVRVDNPLVEGGTGFFFPEQARRTILVRGTPSAPPVWVEAADVQVQLVPLRLPRLRGLLPPEARQSWAGALQATEHTLQGLQRPRLRIDLAAGKAWANAELIPLSHSQLLWYAALAHARLDGDGWLAADPLPLRARLLHLGRSAGGLRIKNRCLLALLDPRPDALDSIDPDNLRVLRSQTRRALQNALATVPNGALLVPEIQTRRQDGVKQTLQRIPLEAERIQLQLQP